MIVTRFIFSAVAAWLFAAAAPAVSAGPEPVDLFFQICTEGGGKLSKEMVTPLTFETLPDEVKGVLGKSRRDDQTSRRSYGKLKVEDVPNQLLQVNGPNAAYLVLPTDTKASRVSIASQCVAMWRGSQEDLVGTGNGLLKWLADKSGKPTGEISEAVPSWFAGNVYYLKDTKIVLVRRDGWIIMKSMPNAGQRRNLGYVNPRPVEH